MKLSIFHPIFNLSPYVYFRLLNISCVSGFSQKRGALSYLVAMVGSLLFDIKEGAQLKKLYFITIKGWKSALTKKPFKVFKVHSFDI